MALLPETERARLWRAIQRYWSNLREGTNFSKADLKAAIDAADVWRENNAASYNTALPQPFRSNATAAQKSLVLCYVVMKNFGFRVENED